MFERALQILGYEKKGTLATPSPELLSLFGVMATASGAAVTPESAMRCAPWGAAVRIMGESVGQIPLHLYKRGPDNARNRATDHPLEIIFTGQANPWTSAYEFRRDMEAAVCAHGFAAAFINRVDGVVKELIQLPSSAVTVEFDATTMVPVYSATMGDGTRRVFGYDEIFYLGSLGISPGCPVRPWSQAREAIGLAMVMEQHAANLFANGARPSGVVKHPKPLGSEAKKRLRESFDAVHAGGANSGKTLLLDEGIDWQSLTFNSVDMQFLELRKYQVAEISRFTRIPLHMLAEMGDATYSNIEQMGGEFVSLALMPHLKLWEGAISRSLLTQEERGTYYAEFLTDDLARADMAARFTAYTQAVTNGIFNPNEIRAMENKPPYEGGDEFRRPLNTETPDAAKPASPTPPAKPRLVA